MLDRRRSHDGGDARRELRADHRHPEGRRATTRRCALMNDYALRPDRGRLHAATRRARAELLARVNAGSVYWNCCDRVSPRLPWSGHGDSGVGVTLSTYGIQAFTRPRRLAPALGLSAASRHRQRRRGWRCSTSTALLLAGDTDVLVVRVPDRRAFSIARPSAPPIATSPIATRRGEITPVEFAAFYAATLAGRVAPSMGAAARALRRQRDRAAHRRGLVRPRRAPPRAPATGSCSRRRPTAS